MLGSPILESVPGALKDIRLQRRAAAIIVLRIFTAIVANTNDDIGLPKSGKVYNTRVFRGPAIANLSMLMAGEIIGKPLRWACCALIMRNSRQTVKLLRAKEERKASNQEILRQKHG